MVLPKRSYGFLKDDIEMGREIKHLGSSNWMGVQANIFVSVKIPVYARYSSNQCQPMKLQIMSPYLLSFTSVRFFSFLSVSNI